MAKTTTVHDITTADNVRPIFSLESHWVKASSNDIADVNAASDNNKKNTTEKMRPTVPSELKTTGRT